MADPAVALRLQNALVKARPVKIVGRKDALLQRRRAEGRGIDRQIAPLEWPPSSSGPETSPATASR